VQVYIKYVGMLKGGKVVESNVNEKPYKFKLGNILSNTLISVLNHEFLMSHNR
jgi:FKBP-type peptidyl-prolyl cis-trans isomerase